METCAKCKKPLPVCVCDRSELRATRIEVVVLQHPQEQDAVLGSAPVLVTNLAKARIVVGLSWRSLAQVVGREVDAKRWGVIFPKAEDREPETEDRGPRAKNRLEGILVLDGTWSQAKTLWWRNPWLLKLQRLPIAAREPSIYGALRKEPKRNYLSTLEAAAEALVACGEPEEVRTHLRRVFRTMVQRARDAQVIPPPAPRPRRSPKRPRRPRQNDEP